MLSKTGEHEFPGSFFASKEAGAATDIPLRPPPQIGHLALY